MLKIVRTDNEYGRVLLIIGILFLIILAAMFAVPFLNEAGTLVHLDGDAWIMDHQALWDTLDPFSSLLYSLGDVGCHQEHARTIILNGNEMPLCIRDTFILSGFAIGFILHGLGLTVDRYAFVIGMVLVALTLGEWSLEHYLDIGNSVLRSVVSVISGIGAVMMVNELLRWETAFLDRKKAQRKKHD